MNGVCLENISRFVAVGYLVLILYIWWNEHQFQFQLLLFTINLIAAAEKLANERLPVPVNEII